MRRNDLQNAEYPIHALLGVYRLCWDALQRDASTTDLSHISRCEKAVEKRWGSGGKATLRVKLGHK